MTSKVRALVVDDDETVRYTVRGILEQAKLEVDEAADGVEGARTASRRTSTSSSSPTSRCRNMDGLELLKRIRQRPQPQPKVIVMTAHGSERHAVEAIKSGAYDYFRKPFEVERDDGGGAARRPSRCG